ncbi:2-isopropylmalate synthase [bioreactor metagenome]|uniref:2-isopropylmalate synthase n=1 Tax=bioreactor metagenome TaxID=1076179 RepID=A0A644Z5U4_9ZZZZ
MTDKLIIFDTTLRDGEQSPGASMTKDEKLRIARLLERLKVDVIEAGFAASSNGDFECIRSIAGAVKDSTICSLSRANDRDIARSAEALAGANSARIHVFLATSPLHMEKKLRMTPDQVFEQAVSSIRFARNLCSDIEFSAEDGYRSDPDFLCRVFEAVIKEGATTINVPDTVGYAIPELYGEFIKNLRERIPNSDKAIWSVHCHNDLGMAVANSLAGVKIGGARQVECTINGLGERAGNCSLEEVVMAIKTRKDYFGLDVNIDTQHIVAASRMVSQTTGFVVQPNKAVVGANAFAHASGIHQDGVLKARDTYEIMRAEDVGWSQNKLVLGKHSGRHAFNERVHDLGFTVDRELSNMLFKRFKDLADKKKTVSDRDIEALIRSILAQEIPKSYALERYVINSGNSITPTSSIVLVKSNGERTEKVAIGFGPVDASFNAINKIVRMQIRLEEYSIGAVTEGRDAQGEVSVKISSKGATAKGYGLSTDVIEASILAYVNAINNLIYGSTTEQE